MLARDLTLPVPMVELDSDAAAAARILADQRLVGLVVADEAGRPRTVLSVPQVLRQMIPPYMREDPGLARSVDPASADRMYRRLAGSRVRDLLPPTRHASELPVVDGAATSLEVASVMAQMRSPLVAVVDAGRYLGAISSSRLLEHLLTDLPADP